MERLSGKLSMNLFVMLCLFLGSGCTEEDQTDAGVTDQSGDSDDAAMPMPPTCASVCQERS